MAQTLNIFPDGCSFLYEDDCSTVTFDYVMEPHQRPRSRPFASCDTQDTHPHDNIRAWLDGVVTDEEHRPLVADVLHAISGLQQSSENHKAEAYPEDRRRRTETRVTVRTLGPGFTGRAPPLASTEFFANLVVVAILLLFAPGFTLLAAGIFFTSRVAERWGGHD